MHAQIVSRRLRLTNEKKVKKSEMRKLKHSGEEGAPCFRFSYFFFLFLSFYDACKFHKDRFVLQSARKERETMHQRNRIKKQKTK